MKIDTDLRLAIRSAEKAQPSDNWQERERRNAESIADFLRTNPAKARKVNALVDAVAKAEAAMEAARKTLCESFGLRHYNGKLEFSRCGNGIEAFQKAGGKPPSTAGKRWSYDSVMRELAAADAKDCRKILLKYGIKWE